MKTENLWHSLLESSQDIQFNDTQVLVYCIGLTNALLPSSFDVYGADLRFLLNNPSILLAFSYMQILSIPDQADEILLVKFREN